MIGEIEPLLVKQKPTISFSKETMMGWLLLVGTLLVSFPIVMSTQAPYDDEGYVMMTLRTFGEGQPLYSSTHTQYGPAYYFLTESIHSTLGLPLSQNGVRLKTIAFWCFATALCYAILMRLKVAEPLRFITTLLFHLHLDKLSLEPGHPQEWVLVLSMLAIWFVAGSSKSKWGMAASCVALVGMIKLNCGAVLAIPLIAEAYVATRSRMFHTKDLRGSVPIRETRAVLFVVSAGAIVTTVIVLLTLMAGTNWSALLWGLVGQHQRFTTEFYHSIPIERTGVLFAISSILLCLPRFREARDRIAFGLAISAFAVAVLLTLCDYWRPLLHGLEPRGAGSWLVIVGPALAPWLWMQQRERMQTSTVFILCLICLAPAMAYPTPGTQLSLATVFAWLPIAMVLNKFSQGKATDATSTPRARHVWQAALTIALIAVVPWCRWAGNEPLIGQGVSLMRLEPTVANRENAVTRAIINCKAEFLVFDGHNHNRFFFRTGLRPLTASNPTFWPRMLSDQEQSRIIEKIQTCNSLCVVIPPDSEKLAGGKASLVRLEMRLGFQQRESIDGWQIGSRPEE